MSSSLYANSVLLKLKNCHWFTTKLEYLDHTNTPHKLRNSETHTEKLTDLKHSRPLTELRSFLDMCNVCQRFVEKYFHVTAPPNRLLNNSQSPTRPSLKEDQAIAGHSAFNQLKAFSELFCHKHPTNIGIWEQMNEPVVSAQRRDDPAKTLMLVGSSGHTLL